MSIRNLEHLFRPQSVAVIGASETPRSVGATKPHLLRILGPNCVGLLVPALGLNASFAHADALPGKIAFVSQSGALVTAVLDWAKSRGIGFSKFVSLGDSTDVDSCWKIRRRMPCYSFMRSGARPDAAPRDLWLSNGNEDASTRRADPSHRGWKSNRSQGKERYPERRAVAHAVLPGSF